MVRRSFLSPDPQCTEKNILSKINSDIIKRDEMLLCLYTYVTINVIRLYMNTLICSTIERGKQNMDKTWYPSSKQLFMNNLNKTSNSISPKKEWVKMKHEWMPLLNATRLHLCTWRTIKPSNQETYIFKSTVLFHGYFH